MELSAEDVFQAVGIDVGGIRRDFQVSDQALAEERLGRQASQVRTPASVTARGEDVGADVGVHFDAVRERLRLAGAFELVRGE